MNTPEKETTEAPLLPVAVMHFDPATRKFATRAEATLAELRELTVRDADPKWFDVSGVTSPADRVGRA